MLYASSADIAETRGVSYYKGLNKFISADVVALGKLTDLPIYIIEPKAENLSTPKEVAINKFLYNSFAGGYNESTDLDKLKVSCNLTKGIINGDDLYE